jgi:hypothetical protein
VLAAVRRYDSEYNVGQLLEKPIYVKWLAVRCAASAAALSQCCRVSRVGGGSPMY